MTAFPEINLCIVQPVGYVHSLGLLDQARYFRWQFRRLGANVSLCKNRLRHDAVNFVFGAHLGFNVEQTQRQTCIFVNLEQLGLGGAKVSENYIKLLTSSAVVDYDANNLSSYTKHPGDVPLVNFLHAPYLKLATPITLEDRPIDLLFFGSMNPRRRNWIDRIEATGRSVVVFDSPIYGPERDGYIAQSKAVLNVHFYESSRFEQARVSHCLSLGTPVISERTERTQPPDAFEHCMLWLQGDDLEQFFINDFLTPAYFEVMRAGLERFQTSDPIEGYAELLAFAGGYDGVHGKRRMGAPWKPKCMNLGSGKDYQAGWLNVDVLARAQPDLVLDLAQPLKLPMLATSATGGETLLEEGSFELINANNVLEHVPELTALMGNCLRLLKLNGELRIEVPYERAPTAWQDPTHVRAMNENSWIYYMDWFWYLGWFEHRFEMAASSWLDSELKPCEKANAAFMKVILRKVETTMRERTVARTMQPDFGGIDDDWPIQSEADLRSIRLVPVATTQASMDPDAARRSAA